jgi:hypothetical protein
MPLHFFLTLWGLTHVLLLWLWLLEVVTWVTWNCMINFHFWYPSHFISWFNKDWYLDIYDSSWLVWFLELNIHLPFFIKSGTSTLRLPLALLQYMVHRGQVLVNRSSTIIMSHTSIHVFYRLILETLLLIWWIRSSTIVFFI